MIRILDYVFNKDVILYFKKVDFYVSEEYFIRAVLKTGEEIDMKFDDSYWRDKTFAGLVEKGDEDDGE